MMQRKNKAKPGGGANNSGYSSGYDSSNDGNAGVIRNRQGNGGGNVDVDDNEKSKSSPSKPPPIAGGVGIGALTGNNANNPKTKTKVVSVATVKRNKCGTQPFDERWLNLDCCGLVCAGLTYALHAYGVYSFGWILLPPWFSVMDEDGYRTLSFACHFHRTLFILIAFLAVFAHFKAMTTDPGAVPPDANPLPDLDELDNLIKGERSGGVDSSPPRPHAKQFNDGGLNAMERGMAVSQSQAHSSSLMQEDISMGDNGETNGGNGNRRVPQAAQALVAAGAATAAAVGAPAVAMGAAVAGAAGVAGAVAASAGPTNRPNNGGAASQPPRGRRMCRRCQAFKPPRAHHCSICKRCIIKMDHHCPWVNNCVGIGNHKYFLLFIFYTCLSCAYSFFFVTYRFFHCVGHVGRNGHHGPRCVDHPTDLLPLVGLTIEALLFGLFTMCMMVDQWDVVTTNLTHIDRLKGEGHHHHGPHGHGGGHPLHGGYSQLPQRRDARDGTPHGARNLTRDARAGINEVFGTGRGLLSSLSSPASPPAASRFHYTWLSPLHKVCFPDAVRDDIYGYCRPACKPTCGGAASKGLASCALGCNEGARRITKSMEMVGRGGEKGRVAGVGAEEIV